MSIGYTTHLRSDGELMAQAVARDLDAHVPTCPDWNVAKLTIHTGGHHRWVADAIRGRGEPPANPGKPGLRGDELVEWFRQGWRDLADLLDNEDDETVAWSWSGDNRVGFWRRRTALETLVHRYDAQNATGGATPLDPVLSSDGIDEMLFVHAPSDPPPYSGVSARLKLASSDAAGAWLIDLQDGKSPVISRIDGVTDADVSIEGPAQDLLLYVWGRSGAGALSVTGPEDQVTAARTFLED